MCASTSLLGAGVPLIEYATAGMSTAADITGNTRRVCVVLMAAGIFYVASG
jgi:hypothetical protein